MPSGNWSPSRLRDVVGELSWTIRELRQRVAIGWALLPVVALYFE